MVHKPSNVWPDITHKVPKDLTNGLSKDLADIMTKMTEKHGMHVRQTAEELAQEYKVPAQQITEEYRTGIETVGEAIRNFVLTFEDAVKSKSSFMIELGMFDETTASPRELIDNYLTYHEGKPREKWGKKFTAGADKAIEIELPRFEQQIGKFRAKLEPIKKAEDAETKFIEANYPGIAGQMAKIRKRVKDVGGRLRNTGKLSPT